MRTSLLSGGRRRSCRISSWNAAVNNSSPEYQHTITDEAESPQDNAVFESTPTCDRVVFQCISKKTGVQEVEDDTCDDDNEMKWGTLRCQY